LQTKTSFSFHMTLRYCNYVPAVLLSSAGLHAAAFAVPVVAQVCGAVLQVFGHLCQNISENDAVC
jgi:hypothetical protein